MYLLVRDFSALLRVIHLRGILHDMCTPYRAFCDDCVCLHIGVTSEATPVPDVEMGRIVTGEGGSP